MSKVRIILILAIVAVMLWVALSPSVVYAPVPRITLYFLMSFLLAILFGAEAAAKFELKLRAFSFVCMGSAAVCLGALVLLTHLSKPEEKIAVFHVYDENGYEVQLEWKGAVEVPLTQQGLQITKLVTGNTVILIFPEQADNVELRIKKVSEGPVYFGTVSYAGSRKAKLVLGKDLKTSG